MLRSAVLEREQAVDPTSPNQKRQQKLLAHIHGMIDDIDVPKSQSAVASSKPYRAPPSMASSPRDVPLDKAATKPPTMSESLHDVSLGDAPKESLRKSPTMRELEDDGWEIVPSGPSDTESYDDIDPEAESTHEVRWIPTVPSGWRAKKTIMTRPKDANAAFRRRKYGEVPPPPGLFAVASTKVRRAARTAKSSIEHLPDSVDNLRRMSSDERRQLVASTANSVGRAVGTAGRAAYAGWEFARDRMFRPDSSFGVGASWLGQALLDGNVRRPISAATPNLQPAVTPPSRIEESMEWRKSGCRLMDAAESATPEELAKVIEATTFKPQRFEVGDDEDEDEEDVDEEEIITEGLKIVPERKERTDGRAKAEPDEEEFLSCEEPPSVAKPGPS